MSAPPASPSRAGFGGIVRIQLWWSAKLLPVLGIGTLAALAAGTPPGSGLTRLGAMTVSATGIAAASHLVNDWADLNADALAGKPNALSTLRPRTRGALVTAATVLGVAPWLAVSPGGLAAVLIFLLLVVPILYSVPPVRLKGRGMAGVAADAIDAHVLPASIALALMGSAGDTTDAWRWAFASGVLWSAGLGVRSIMAHQCRDLNNDLAAGVKTYVVRHGATPASRWGVIAFGVELAGLVGLAVVTLRTAPIVILGFVALFLLWLMNWSWDRPPFRPVPVGDNAWMPLVEFYEVWPVVTFSIVLVARDPAWWPLTVGLLVGFASAIFKQTTDLILMTAGAAASAIRFWWWLHSHPIAWVRFRMTPALYWTIHDRVADTGHFYRRQLRRYRRLRPWSRRDSPGR